jgi:hypothetical protein
MEEKVQFINSTFLTLRKINCNYQHFKNDIFQVTSITTTTSALLHLTWQKAHYTLQQVISGHFNTPLNLLF